MRIGGRFTVAVERPVGCKWRAGLRWILGWIERPVLYLAPCSSSGSHLARYLRLLRPCPVASWRFAAVSPYSAGLQSTAALSLRAGGV